MKDFQCQKLSLKYTQTMVDSIDFDSFDISQLSQESGEEQQELSQQSLSATQNDIQPSLDFAEYDYEFNFSQLSQLSPSTASASHSHSASQSQDGEKCVNCEAINTLQEDTNSGHKMCTNCGHIVQVKLDTSRKDATIVLMSNQNTLKI